jgi:hypothetical protein
MSTKDKMRKAAQWMAVIVSTWALQPEAQSLTTISLANSSFESPTLANGSSTTPIPGWNIVANNFTDDPIGMYNPTGFGIYPGGVPDGTNIAYLGYTVGMTDGLIWQGTSELFQDPDRTYTLSAYLGRRSIFVPTDSPHTYLEIRSSPTASYSDSTLLKQLAVPANTVASGTFQNFSLSFGAQDANFASLLAAHSGENLLVTIGVQVAANKESDVDLVAFSYVIPEPGSVLMFGLGGVLLLARRRGLTHTATLTETAKSMDS